MRRTSSQIESEIQVRGDCLFSGYYNDDEGSRDAFADGWHRTGDLGFLLDGELYVTGREKDLIIISGHNVYPHDIENAVGSLPGIKPGRAVAFGVYDDGEGTERLVVMAEIDARSPSGEAGPDEEDALKATIRDNVLSRFFVNVSDIRLFSGETLRKSTSGKLARNANRELFLEARPPRRRHRLALLAPVDVEDLGVFRRRAVDLDHRRAARDR